MTVKNKNHKEISQISVNMNEERVSLNDEILLVNKNSISIKNQPIQKIYDSSKLKKNRKLKNLD